MNLTKTIATLSGVLSVLAVADVAQAQCQVQKLTGFDIVDGDEFGGRVYVDGNIAVVGMTPSAPAGPRLTAGYIFERDFGGTANWGFRQKLEPMDVVLGDGASDVAVNGDFIVMGYERHDHDGADDGAAYVFQRDPADGSWAQCAELTPDDALPGRWFGSDVAISGNFILVGARTGSGSGLLEAAYVFDLTAGCGQWVQVAKLTTLDTPTGNGNTVALSGDIAVVGGVLDNHSGLSHPGSAYIYHRNQGGANNWGLVKKVTAEADAANDGFFGTDVSIDGNTIVVSANFDASSQSAVAYIFERDVGGADNWGRRARILPSGCGGHISNSIAGDVILVGAGCVFRPGTNGMWDDGSVDLVATIIPCDGPAGFGIDVATDGNTAVIGANFDDDTCPGDPGCELSGSAYVFDLTECPGPDCNENGIRDECELVDNDCNANGIPDECEIDLNSTAPGGPFFCDPAMPPAPLTECDPDCNGNGTPDECDIREGGAGFADFRAWATFDPSKNGVGTDPVGYAHEAAFDGRYLYFAPVRDSSHIDHGEVLRYDTQANFLSAGSWSTYDYGADPNGCALDANCIHPPDGFAGAFFDGQTHVYFAPAYNGIQVYGQILRYDVTGDFADGASWEAFDPVTTVEGAYASGIAIGGRAYFAPWSAPPFSQGRHGEALRFNLAGSFTDAASWEPYNYGDNCVTCCGSGCGAGTCCHPEGYLHTVYDGRYLYYIPNGYFDAGTGIALPNGEVLRFDTTGVFADGASWEAFDPSVQGVSTKAVGFKGGVFDGRYVYFVPSIDGQGEFLRFDTTGDFRDVSAWATFDPVAAGVVPQPRGYKFATMVGPYIYFTNQQNDIGEMLRYDTRSDYFDPASWQPYDYGQDPAGCAAQAERLGLPCNFAVGYEGTGTDGRYVYFVPFGGPFIHGEVMRYDTQFATDCNENGIPDECEEDCNENGVPDDCDIDPTDPDGNGQVSPDVNGNGIPDECEVVDCNQNGIPDEEEGTQTLAFVVQCPNPPAPCADGTRWSFLLDWEGPDVTGVCGGPELAGGQPPDLAAAFGQCIADAIDATLGTSCPIVIDQPGNGGVFRLTVPGSGALAICVGPEGGPTDCCVADANDRCAFNPDLVLCPPSGQDCNGNATDDAIDICAGSSPDSNGNGVPDECEGLIPTVSNWGLVVMTLLVLTAGTVLLRRGRAAMRGL